MYQKISEVLTKFLKPATIYKYLFNLSPMYRRSTGRIRSVSEDLHQVVVEIPFTYKNKNYAGTIFGGSLFSATDPIYMIQLIQILGDSYVVWDKSATIHYKRPAKEKVIAVFEFTGEEIEQIKKIIEEQKEVVWEKKLNIANEKGIVFCQLEKVLYIADRSFYKEKQQRRKEMEKERKL